MSMVRAVEETILNSSPVYHQLWSISNMKGKHRTSPKHRTKESQKSLENKELDQNNLYFINLHYLKAGKKSSLSSCCSGLFGHFSPSMKDHERGHSKTADDRRSKSINH
ncbi:uncharacterized protein ACNLHF_022871 [Anomaloglossus baeobatrachus]